MDLRSKVRIIDDPEGKAIMAVPGKTLGDIGGLHQRQSRQSGELFDGCVFLFVLHPFHALKSVINATWILVEHRPLEP